MFVKENPDRKKKKKKEKNYDSEDLKHLKMNDEMIDLNVLIDFKTKKEISVGRKSPSVGRPSIGRSDLKDKCSKSSSVFFLKRRE